MLNNFYTYIHIRATDDVVFYVGQGKGQRAYTLAWHNKYWHSTVAKHGYYVKLIKTDLTKEEAALHEIELIAHYKVISGPKLTNMTSGGDGGMLDYKHTDEAKKKISKASKGNQYWKLGTGFKGKKHSEETKKIIREKRALQAPTRLGQSPSEETKEKIRKANLGKKQSAETISRKVLAQTGNVRSLEAIAKTSEKCKGQKRTPEQREKMRLAQLKVPRKGKPLSETVKANILLSIQKRFSKTNLSAD